MNYLGINAQGYLFFLYFGAKKIKQMTVSLFQTTDQF
jgi:hypothetical protein